ncbi:MAG TPA: MazG family protein [Thermomicrobiales bacterium]|nr:MazG family protein [Thermomicrobiales bacterium]
MPPTLTIVGLGPGDPQLRTVAAQRALDAADHIILRTGIHPGLADLLADARVTTCDDIYELGGSFDEVYAKIAERVVEAAITSDLVYAVPGNPAFGERTLAAIRERLVETSVNVVVQSAVSALDVVATALGVDPLSGQAQLVDAADLSAAIAGEPFSGGLIDLSPSKPCLVMQVYSPGIASDVKLALTRLYPDEHQVTLISAAGVGIEETVRACQLFEIDRYPVDHLKSLWVPALPELDVHRTAASLQRITAHLRSPEGCPWDRKQNHASLRGAVIEEAFEVVDAIDAGDVEHLAEELGDLLLQVFLQSQIAEEQDEFLLEDVYEQITTKLIRRHPHVFGEDVARTPDAVVQTWERIKAQERRQKGETATEPAPLHPLDKLPRSMPAMQKVARALAKQGAGNGALSYATRDVVANQLFDAVAGAVSAGLDPESELERVARQRMDHEQTADAADGETS